MTDTSTPRRFKTDSGLTIGGRVYEDDEQTRFAISCSSIGLGLPSYGDFIDSISNGDEKQEMLDWREQAFNSFKSNNQLALKGWLQAMYAAWNFRLTIDDIRPNLSMSLDFSKSQAKKGKKGGRGTRSAYC